MIDNFKIQTLAPTQDSFSVSASFEPLREDLENPEDFVISGIRSRVQGSGFRVQGSGYRVQGTGFRVQGSGKTSLNVSITFTVKPRPYSGPDCLTCAMCARQRLNANA